MKKQIIRNITLKTIIFTLVLCLSFTVLVAADDDEELVGTFYLEGSKAIKINSVDYAPLEEVAGVLNLKFDWERDKTKVEGYLDYDDFESNYFLVAYGQLYLPFEFYEDEYDIELKRKGNKYYVYSEREDKKPVKSELELVLQTDHTGYRWNEPMAVSLLLLNESKRTYPLRFNSDHPYDLILKRRNSERWRLSDNKRELRSLSIEVLKSGDYRLFTVLIEPGDDKYLSSGEYILVAEIKSENGIIVRDEINIEIY